MNPLLSWQLHEVISEKDIKMSTVILGKGGQAVVLKGTWWNVDVAIKSMKLIVMKCLH